MGKALWGEEEVRPDELIQKLRKRRRELKITQEQLASKIGVTSSYYSLIERGKRTCSLKNFVNTCEMLDLEITIEKKEIWHNYETGEADFIDFPTEENVKFYLPYVKGVSVGYFAYLAHRQL